MPVEQLTDEWLAGPQGMQEPFWVEKPEGLGMKMPHGDMTVGEVAEVVGQSSWVVWCHGRWELTVTLRPGPQTQVEVIGALFLISDMSGCGSPLTTRPGLRRRRLATID